MIGLVTRRALLEQPAGHWVALEEDRLLATLLVCRGLPVRVVAWDDERVDWSAFTLLVLRSTRDAAGWCPPEYLAWLRRVETLTTVCNPRSVLEWREQTDALDQLAASGVPLAAPLPPRQEARCDTHAIVLLRNHTTEGWLIANAWRTVPSAGTPSSTRETLLVPAEEEVALAHQTLRALYRTLGPVMNACLVVRLDLQKEAGQWWVQDVDLHASYLLLPQRRQAAWCLVDAIEARYRCASPGQRVGQEVRAPRRDEVVVVPERVPPRERAQAHAAGAEWRQGVFAGLPLALSILPFMTIFAVEARAAGLSAFVAQAMSLLIFSGVQLVATQMLLSGSPLALIVGLGSLLNLRHLFYGAALTPYVRTLPLGWRCLLGYLLTDEAYALASTHYQQPGNPEKRHWYLLGAGLTVWVAAQAGTALGSALGASLPSSWELSFTATLSFIALAVLTLKDRPSLAAALTAGLVSVEASGLPLKLGLLAAALFGILAGVGVEALTQTRLRHKEATAHEDLGSSPALRGHYFSGAIRLLVGRAGRALAPASAGIALPPGGDAARAHPAHAPRLRGVTHPHPGLAPDRWGHRRAGGVADPPGASDGARGDGRALVAPVGVVTAAPGPG